MDASVNEEPHFKGLAVLTRLKILTAQRKIKTISFIQQHLLKPATSSSIGPQEKTLQDFFSPKPDCGMVTALYPVPYCIVKTQHSPLGINGSYTHLHQQRICLQLFSDQQQLKYILKNLFVLHSLDFENRSVHV